MNKKQSLVSKENIILFVLIVSLFMLWGIAISMGDTLNRHFQNVLQISKSQSSLVQFSLFGAYAVMGIPAGIFMRKFGYKKGVLLGLLLYAIGCFLFIPAADKLSFTFFRFALFVLACGLATLETVAHPFAAALGHEQTSDMRLNFAQSFNGLGGIIGPLLGGYFLLKGAHNGLDSVERLYTVIGFCIMAVAISFSFVKVPNLSNRYETSQTGTTQSNNKSIFAYRHFRWAVLAQFCNVAAQGGTWAYFINYGIEKIDGLTDEKAAYYFAFSMFLMMVGRFVSTFLMRFIKPNVLLAVYAAINSLLCIIIAQSWGYTSFVALILLNFFLSVMFPTIFSLGMKKLGDKTKQASSYIVMGVTGGAVFPPLMGLIADKNIAASYYLPIVCYIVIILFGLKFSKVNNQ